jgi:hypothetical protein
VNSSTQFDVFPTFWNGSIFVKQVACSNDLPTVESVESDYRCQDDLPFPRFVQHDAADDRRNLTTPTWYSGIWSNETTTLPLGENYINFADLTQLDGHYSPRLVDIGSGAN